MVEFLKWPIVLLLAFTSFPAGGLPFAILGSYRERLRLEHESPRLRDQRQIERARQDTYLFTYEWIGAIAIQTTFSWIAWKRWNLQILGLRGAAWFAMLWGTFAVGVVTGIAVLWTGG